MCSIHLYLYQLQNNICVSVCTDNSRYFNPKSKGKLERFINNAEPIFRTIETAFISNVFVYFMYNIASFSLLQCKTKMSKLFVLKNVKNYVDIFFNFIMQNIISYIF